MNNWRPKEIIINRSVDNDPVTKYFLNQCPDVPVKYVSSGNSERIKKASQIISNAGTLLLDKILAGKEVVYIAPAGEVVDRFKMPDTRIACPHFNRLKLAYNGCFYRCEWCYLKLTCRAKTPFITVRAEYGKIKAQVQKKLSQSPNSIMYNAGELADSLSMEHLTRAGQEFIPWFGETKNGYLFMLTKSGNVGPILDLPHNGRTILAWSLNAPLISNKFEIGAPPFKERLEAARKAEKAGYRVRIRLDPIVFFKDWKTVYAQTIKEIFSQIDPERITLGTLRFETGFYQMRNSLFTTGPFLPKLVEEMKPMFKGKIFPGYKKPKIGKYSFGLNKRIKNFRFVINQIRKYSKAPIALCKEDRRVWKFVGLDLRKCRCVCQLDSADMTKINE